MADIQTILEGLSMEDVGISWTFGIFGIFCGHLVYFVAI
jgi:hypothetical protein